MFEEGPAALLTRAASPPAGSSGERCLGLRDREWLPSIITARTISLGKRHRLARDRA